MFSLVKKLILLVVATVLLASRGILASDDDDTYKAFLLLRRDVHTKISSAKQLSRSAVPGEEVTVFVSLYNEGDGPATNINVNFGSDPNGEVFILDPTPVDIPRIGAGQKFTLEYIFYVNKLGNFTVPAVTASYQQSIDAMDFSLRSEITSDTFMVEIISEREQKARQLLAIGRFVTLGQLQTKGDWATALVLSLGFLVLSGGVVLYHAITTKQKVH